MPPRSGVGGSAARKGSLREELTAAVQGACARTRKPGRWWPGILEGPRREGVLSPRTAEKAPWHFHPTSQSLRKISLALEKLYGCLYGVFLAASEAPESWLSGFSQCLWRGLRGSRDGGSPSQKRHRQASAGGRGQLLGSGDGLLRARLGPGGGTLGSEGGGMKERTKWGCRISTQAHPTR